MQLKTKPSSFGINPKISITLSSKNPIIIHKKVLGIRQTPKMAADSSSSEAKVHIVYTERPEDEEPDAYHIKTLTPVLGSEDAAKEALVYSYKHAASGFSAKLTPDQVSQLSKQPGVLQVVPSQTLQLHSGLGKTQV